MTTLENGLRSVGEQWDELMENADEDGGEQVLVHAGDVTMFDYCLRREI